MGVSSGNGLGTGWDGLNVCTTPAAAARAGMEIVVRISTVVAAEAWVRVYSGSGVCSKKWELHRQWPERWQVAGAAFHAGSHSSLRSVYCGSGTWALQR